MENNLKLQSPWVTYVGKVRALFDEDKDIRIDYDEDNLTLKMYVDCATKADALMKLLPTSVPFGNVTLNIEVIPGDEDTSLALIAAAFAGNPRFSQVITGELPGTGVPITFAMFKPEVLQFYNDDLTDYYGNWNGIAADIAKEIFNHIDGVNYSTDIID